MTTTLPPAITLDNLRVERGGREILHGVSLTVPKGSITGLLGPSGCGKTTLMRSVVGTQIIKSGAVTVLGRPAGSAALRSHVGYVTQAASIYNDLTVQENVRYFAALYGRKGSVVDDAVAAVGMGPYLTQRGDELSGGQRTRVSLACALVCQPELLVMDEPTVGLDPVLRAELWERFRELAKAGTTLLVSSHVMDEAEHCHQLLLMRDGRLLAQLSPAELRTRTGDSSLEGAFLALIKMEEVA